MKMILKVCMLCVLSTTWVCAQNKVDEERMTRDMEVAKNVLGTLIKQQFKRTYFLMNVEGDYVAGYGATFRLPSQYGAISFGAINVEPIRYMNQLAGGGSSDYYSQPDRIGITVSDDGKVIGARKEPNVVTVEGKKEIKGVAMDKSNRDSVATADRKLIIEAAKNFIADYGDLVSQIAPNEKIVVTNQGNGQNYTFNSFNGTKRAYISVEAVKGDVSQFRQGKMTREQLMTKMKVVNSEAVLELDPDLELFSSILSRLYQQDLSRTYFVDRSSGLNYERLKDFGVIYYLQMRSSNQTSADLHSIPTLRLNNIDQKTRDAKVKELYPAFEKEIKEYVLDYGRTLKSLKDDESLILNVKLTKCEACGIPASLELNVKESVLKEYGSGSITKDAALTRITIKKSSNQ